ncbi:universal stress protein [Heliobacterium gestii]|uniref:Universal stress protein n=1 Tax=Heliomicrobium gestii TaxID=2699 RepID=A0A845LF80_HELGE|nr:universal stress protein [Heliomicrobium gestii]MBM7866742.1 nucleotide-binding universal stress UspA family protein [Heliomicrobium gestii]MZP42173.1 universal stress protein [Heliomicrobium gestii]
MFKKILLATDGSEHALKAARYACHLMKLDPQIETTILYVFDLSHQFFLGSDGAVFFDPDILKDKMSELAGQILATTKALFEAEGLTCQTEATMGHPAFVIVDTAEHNGADLIIMGSRGMGEFRSFLSGSVSDRVFHLAKCPVMVIKEHKS